MQTKREDALTERSWSLLSLFPLLVGITVWLLSGFIICCMIELWNIITHSRMCQESVCKSVYTPVELWFAGCESVLGSVSVYM